MEQKVKISDGKMNWFFFDHSFKTAYQHAQDFLARNANNGKTYSLYLKRSGAYLFKNQDLWVLQH
jgi:hypothetical protein